MCIVSLLLTQTPTSPNYPTYPYGPNYPNYPNYLDSVTTIPTVLWPEGLPTGPVSPTLPAPVPNSLPNVPNFEQYKVYAELLHKAAEYDRITKQPNCHDPKKMEFLKELMIRMDVLGEEFKTISEGLRNLFDEKTI